MDHSAAVRFFETLADFNPVLQHLLGRQWPFPEAVPQSLPFQKLHDDEVDSVLTPHIVEMTNVGMTQARNGSRFAFEALLGSRVVREMDGENLDRHRAFQSCVTGAVHLTHPPGAQRRLNLIRPEFCARGECHPCAPLYSRGSASQ